MTSTKPFPTSAFIALLIGGTAIGFAAILVLRLADVNPIAVAFWRMALSAPFLWIWAFATRKQDQASGKRTDFKMALALAGMYFGGDMALWHVSLHYTTVANATLLSNFAPIFIALWMWHMHKVRFTPIFIMGMLGALVGAVMLVGPNMSSAESSGGHKLFGDAIGFSSAIFYAGYQWTIKEARNQYSTARLMAWSTTITGLTLLPFALMLDGPVWPPNASTWLLLFALAISAQIGGQTVIAYASAHLPASLSSVSLLVQPLTGAIAAWILFNESMGTIQLLGAGLLLWASIYRGAGVDVYAHPHVLSISSMRDA